MKYEVVFYDYDDEEINFIDDYYLRELLIWKIMNKYSIPTDLLKEITTAISTRNNILKALEDFINYDFNDPVGMSVLAHVISDDGLNRAKEAQRFMNTVFKWQLPF